MAPCWSNASHHILQTSMRHIIDPISLQFLNMIRIKKLVQNEIDNVLSCCYASKTKVLSHIDSDTAILYSHCKYVNKYNDSIICKMFHANKSVDVMMETNVMGVEHVENWLHDSKFDHIKYVAIGARIMITKNISISKGIEIYK